MWWHIQSSQKVSSWFLSRRAHQLEMALCLPTSGVNSHTTDLLPLLCKSCTLCTTHSFTNSNKKDSPLYLITCQAHPTIQEKRCSNHVVKPFPKLSQMPGTFSFPSSVSSFFFVYIPTLPDLPNRRLFSANWDMQGSGSHILLPNAPNLWPSSTPQMVTSFKASKSVCPWLSTHFNEVNRGFLF